MVIAKSVTGTPSDQQAMPKLPPLENGDRLSRPEFERRLVRLAEKVISLQAVEGNILKAMHDF